MSEAQPFIHRDDSADERFAAANPAMPPAAHPPTMPNVQYEHDDDPEIVRLPTTLPVGHVVGYYVPKPETGTPPSSAPSDTPRMARTPEVVMRLNDPTAELSRRNFVPVMPPPHGLADKLGVNGLAARIGLKRPDTRGRHSPTLEEYIQDNAERLVRLCDRVPTLTVTLVATKSSAKTTTAVHTALLATKHRKTMLFDANPSGRLAERFGQVRNDSFDMKSLAKLAQDAEQNTSRYVAEIIGNPDLTDGQKVEMITKATSISGSAKLDIGSVGDLINHKSNLGGIGFVAMAPRLSGEDAKRVMRASRGMAEYRFFDTGNVINDPRAKAILESTDVVVFTANAATKDSLPMLLENMREMRELGFGSLIDHSIVVFSNLTGRERETDGAVRLEHRRGDLCVIKQGHAYLDQEPHSGALLGVPADLKVASDENYNLDGLDRRTLAAYQNVLIAVLEERQRQLEKIV